MTVSAHTVTAVVEVGGGITLDVIDARITLDDGWMPYIQAELTCWNPGEVDLELIDPREHLRVTLTVSKEFGTWNVGQLIDQARTFDLLLRGRTVNHISGAMTLIAESDEALLEDLALVATASERTYGLSVKNAATFALSKIGATLKAGAADAILDPDPNLPATVTNLITNPNIETNTTGWSDRSSTGSFTRTSTQKLVGTYSLSFKLTAAGSGSVWANDYIAMAAGTQLTWSFYIRSTTAKNVHATLLYFNSSNTQVGSADGATVLTSTSAWSRVTVTGTVTGTGATKVRPVIYVESGTTSETYYVDCALLAAGSSLPEFFDGATADDNLYDFAWTGTANASTSTKTAKPNTEAMIWQPGATLWDYLEPLLQATGLRLYCNEDREWILEPSGTALDGQINIAAGINVTDAADEISLREEWYDAVVIAYTKAIDADGKQVTAYDAAGGPGTKTLTLEYARPYPGAGAAQAVLNRAQGRGRVLKLEAISDYLATPGMSLSASLPDSPIQTGTISSVEWSWPADRMRIGSRGLTDTPETAWLLAPAGLAWEDMAAGTDWTEYTP